MNEPGFLVPISSFAGALSLQYLRDVLETESSFSHISWVLLNQVLSGTRDERRGPPALRDHIILHSIFKLQVTGKISFVQCNHQK